MALKDFVLSKLVRGILSDPVYKDFYLLEATHKNGDIILSPVMDHNNYMIYEAGLRSKAITGEIISFRTLGRGAEDDISDLLYSETKLNKQYN